MMTVRACQCSFCRKHNTLAAADPSGRVAIRIDSDNAVSRYSFGLATAEYLICRSCGVYVSAVTREEPRRALVIINCLDARELFSGTPLATNYDHESEQDRRHRRQSTWTPVRFE